MVPPSVAGGKEPGTTTTAMSMAPISAMTVKPTAGSCIMVKAAMARATQPGV